MNCKPGDLAYIKVAPYKNHFVSVLSWVNQGRHVYPDGYDGFCRKAGWLSEKANGTFSAPLAGGGRRDTRYAVIYDEFLHPIGKPPEEAQDETLSWLPVPSCEEMV